MRIQWPKGNVGSQQNKLPRSKHASSVEKTEVVDRKRTKTVAGNNRVVLKRRRTVNLAHPEVDVNHIRLVQVGISLGMKIMHPKGVLGRGKGPQLTAQQ